VIHERDSVLLRTDGSQIHYHVYEAEPRSGRDFLFIHGLGSNWTRWKRLANEPFFVPYRRIIPDLRGHGESITRTGIDADGFADDLEEILDKEGSRRPIVIGHCLGANVAVRLWERNSQRIHALVLIEPFVTEELFRPWKALNAFFMPFLNALKYLVRGFNRAGLRRARFRRIDYSVYDDWVRSRLTNVVNVIRFMGPWMDLQCMPVAAYIDSYRMLFRYHPPWQAIRVPVLAVLARHGGVVSPDFSRHPLSGPEIQKVGIEASHFVLTDNREGVVREIESFVQLHSRDIPWKN